MLKLENYDLEKIDVLSTSVEFSQEQNLEVPTLTIEFNSPKLKKIPVIENVQHRNGTSGSNRNSLF